MDTAKARVRSPQLPIEVWARIIGSITDSRYIPRAWLHFRLVSRMFKAATEMAFVSTHLPKLRIRFTGPTPRAADYQFLLVDLRFARLSEDRSRAIFALAGLKGDKGPDEWVLSTGERLAQRRRKALQACIQDYVEAIQHPDEHHWQDVCSATPLLVMRRLANDTILSGVEADYEKGEISVLWRSMLSMLFGEDEFGKWAERISGQHNKQVTLDMWKNLRAKRLRRWFTKHRVYVRDEVVRAYVQRFIPENHTLAPGLGSIKIDDEWVFEGEEEGRGMFYDGSGVTFMGLKERERMECEDLMDWQHPRKTAGCSEVRLDDMDRRMLLE